MPRLTRKADLLARFEEGVRASGRNLLYLTQGVHPALYRIYAGEKRRDVKVYIWNISHGGGNRAASEYRIQITGIKQFDEEPGRETLILGWWEDVGVFAGWDVRQHRGVLGASPSMQVGEAALRQAVVTGFAPYRKANNETAVAFRPDFLGAYIDNLISLHDSGSIPKEEAVLSTISMDPSQDTDAKIDSDVDASRKYAIFETRKALRALDFSRRVLSAYGHQCAMCSVQLRLIDGAHILPVAHSESTDHTSNGIALCALHHRAYDRGLVTFDAQGSIHLNKKRAADLKDEKRVQGLKNFIGNLRPFIISPPDKKDRPRKSFVEKANALRGW